MGFINQDIAVTDRLIQIAFTDDVVPGAKVFLTNTGSNPLYIAGHYSSYARDLNGVVTGDVWVLAAGVSFPEFLDLGSSGLGKLRVMAGGHMSTDPEPVLVVDDSVLSIFVEGANTVTHANVFTTYDFEV